MKYRKAAPNHRGNHPQFRWLTVLAFLFGVLAGLACEPPFALANQQPPLATIWSTEESQPPPSFLEFCQERQRFPREQPLFKALERWLATTDCTELRDRLRQRTALVLPGQAITSVVALTEFNHFQFVNLAQNEIHDARPLAANESLEALYLQDNQLGSLEGLGELAALLFLDVSYNELVSLRGLSGAQSLIQLQAAGNDLRDLRGLVAPNLETLVLYNNQLRDVAGIEHFRSLASLDISHNRIASLNPLRQLQGLSYLLLSYNRITDLGVLAEHKSLTTLYLDLNPLASLRPLRGLQQLVLFSAKGIDLGSTVAKTPENCPQGADVAPVVAAFCQAP